MAQAAADANNAAGMLAGQVRGTSADAKAALAEAERVDALSGSLLSKLEPEAQSNPDLASTLAAPQSGTSTLASATETLFQAANSLSDAADVAADATSTIKGSADETASNITALAKDAQSTTIPEMQRSLDAANTAIGNLMGITASIRVATDETANAINGLTEAMASATSSIDGAKEILSSIDETLGQTMTDLGALHASNSLAQVESYLKLDPNDVSQFLASPVKVKTEAIYPVKNYGSGVAPFFTNLALWVSGFILMAIVRIKVDLRACRR